MSGASTFSNGYFVGQALGLVSGDRVPVTPTYSLEQFEALAPSLTPESVYQAVLAHAVPLDDPLIRFTGRTAPEGAEDGLRTAFADGMALPISAPEDTGIIEFGYDDFGEPGTVVADEIQEELGIRQITFANGVRLNLKKTDIREDRIRVAVRVDGGELMVTKEDPLRVYLANSLTSGGLGKHSVDELQTVLAGRSVSSGFGSGAEGFSMGGSTTPRDLELQMKVFAAILTDPGYRAEGVERFRQGIDNFFETLNSTPGRAYSTAMGARLSDNDPRFSLQSKEDFFALDYAQLQSVISDRLKEGAIEVALVGDLDEDAAIAAVAATLAALPTREADFLPRDDARQRTFTETRGLVELKHEGEADQALLRMVWPTTDDDDYAEALRLSLLGRVVRLELTDRLREELGQAYSPSAGSSTSSVYDDYGTFSISASVDVSEVAATRAAVLDLLADLRNAPLDQDVIERARKPILESYDNALKGLGGWMSLTARAQSEPERIERWFAAPDLLKAITPEDIQAEALQYLDPAVAVEVRVLPGENARAVEEAEPSS